MEASKYQGYPAVLNGILILDQISILKGLTSLQKRQYAHSIVESFDFLA